MTLLSADQAASIAGQMKNTGFQVGSYGGGSGETYHYNQRGLMQNGSINQTNTPSNNLMSKISSIGKTVVNGTVAGAKWIASQPKAEYNRINPFLQGVADVVTGKQSRELGQINDQRKQLDANFQKYQAAYKSGQMSKQQYQRLMKDLSGSYSSLSDNSTQIAKTTSAKDVLESAAETAGLLLSVGKVGSNNVSLATLKTTAGEDAAKLTAGLAGKRGAAVFANNGGKDVLRTMLTQSGNKLEQAVLKIPSARGALERGLTSSLRTEAKQQLVGETTSQFVTRNAKQLAIGLLIKDPIVYHLNIDSGKDIYNEMSTGKYGAALVDASLQALQFIDGPIGTVKGVLDRTGAKLRDLTYGSKSLIDTMSQRIGNGRVDQIANFVKSGKEVTSATGKSKMNGEELFRYVQENNLRRAADDVGLAADNALENYVRAGVNPRFLTPEKFAQDYLNYQEAVDVAKRVGDKGLKGISDADAQNLVVVRFDSMIKRGIANAVRQAGDDKQAMTQVLEGFKQSSGNGWVNNATLMTELARIIDEAPSAEAAAKRIESIPTAKALLNNLSNKDAKDLAKLGYGLAVPEGGKRLSAYVTDYDDTRKLISAVTKGDEEATRLFDPAVAPNPTLETMASFLTKAGLSPQAANERAYQALSSSVAKNLDTLDVAQGLGFKSMNGSEVIGGQVVLSKLQQWVQNQESNKLLAAATLTFGKARPAITDIRQMTSKNIKKALNDGNTGIKITDAEARDISKAVRQGYLDTPLELRGLGDKVLDYAYRYNPAQRYYTRIQGALRYSYNPFFQAQEAVETSVFSGLQGANKATALAENGLRWGKTRAELDGTIAKLEEARIFSSSLGGEAAADQVLGRISADITRGQKRDLAGLAQDLAVRQGRTLDDILENNPEQIEDALRVIVQYPKRGALSTPLARTLNVAFFPMRYNLKVTRVAAEVLSKQPAAVQFATVHSLLNLNDWLQSDEGIQWRAKNADAIQVFNWISPLNNIGSLFNTLGYLKDVATGQPNDGPGALGQLGGLPFGMISQVMDNLGIININKPYVDPKTGDVIPNYIPATLRAKAATAMQDLLGSVFTYPGQTLGLPGKGALLRGLTNKFGLTTQGQYIIQQYTTKDRNGNVTLTEKGEQELTPSQKNLIRVLAGDHSPETMDSLYMNETGMPTLPPTVLPFNLPEKIPTMNKTELAAAKKALKGGSGGKKAKPVAKPVGTY